MPGRLFTYPSNCSVKVMMKGNSVGCNIMKIQIQWVSINDMYLLEFSTVYNSVVQTSDCWLYWLNSWVPVGGPSKLEELLLKCVDQQVLLEGFWADFRACITVLSSCWYGLFCVSSRTHVEVPHMHKWKHFWWATQSPEISSNFWNWHSVVQPVHNWGMHDILLNLLHDILVSTTK